MSKRKREEEDEPTTDDTPEEPKDLSDMLGKPKDTKRSKVESVTENEAEAQRFLEFYDSLSPNQQRRYEAYRRSRISPEDIKELMLNSVGSSRHITTPAAIVVAGLTKLFVGDIVERARVIMQKRKETGPICPQHLRESYRQLQQNGLLPLIRSTSSASLRR